MLSQLFGESPRLQPCAYYSNKLTPAEQNYDIGNRELLAIKLALEEWRLWLEGANHPFTVITDHKNLQYLRQAKRLNPRQARWALFCTRFHFTITYRPGNRNCKADALSRVHSPDSPTEPEPILPPALIVNPIIWNIDQDIRDATLTEPAPLGGPEGKTFVPVSIRQSLLDSVHKVPGSGHPGSQRTLSLLQARYWWPSMSRDTIRYIRSSSNFPPRYRIHPTFHVSLLKPCSSPTPDQREPGEPPPPEILDQPSVYQVRNIMDSWRWGGRLEYLVDWEGYGPEEQSWVARDDILDPMLLQEFHRIHPNRPAPRGRGRPRRRVRASGAAPGGGGSVRESQSQSPPPTTITRSQSPEF